MEKSDKGYHIIGVIETVLMDRFQLPEDLSYPVLIKSKEISQWRLFEKWSVDFLAEKMGEKMMSVMSAESNVMMYYEDFEEEYTRVGIVNKPLGMVREKMTIKEFGWKSKWLWNYRYLSEQFNFSEWIDEGDAPNWEKLMLDDVSESVIWMGTKHATSATHYDQDDNLFLQVKGKKKFILSPPNSTRSMYLHPFIHPAKRQSQLIFHNDLTFNIQNQFAELKNIDAYEVTVSPGDVLYIPPFWYHHVITLEDSISITFWSTSWLTKIKYELYKIEIPLSDDWATLIPHHQLLSAKIFFKLMMEISFGKFTDLYWTIVKNEYIVYYGPWQTEFDPFTGVCTLSNSNRYNDFIKQKEKEYRTSSAINSFLEITKDIPVDQKIMLLTNFFETKIGSLFGSVNANRVIQTCF